MSAPTQSSPAFKRRLISAKLEEPASWHVSPLSSISASLRSPKLVASVAGLASVSALSVFLFLFQHDASTSPSASPLVIQAEESRNSVPVGGEHVPSSEARNSAGQNLAFTAPVEFKLKRSRTFEKIGPVRVRLLRVNLRRRTCDLIMQFSNHRTVQKRLQMNRPVEVRSEPRALPLQITVSSISKDSIAGAVGN
jgi:hypothetical protein